MKESTLEISARLLDTLTTAIEDILEIESHHYISEYTLIKMLQSPPYELLAELSLQHNSELFQIHFLVFHCLYQAHFRRLQSGEQGIQISPLEIRLTTLPESSKYSETIHQAYSKGTTLPKRKNELESYYLDITNLTTTTNQDIEELILSFWTQLHYPTADTESLATLELTPPVTYGEIKKQYKRLASKHHPDKGGCTKKIQAINQAMSTLAQHYTGT